MMGDEIVYISISFKSGRAIVIKTFALNYIDKKQIENIF